MNVKKVGEFIKQKRKEKKLTQKELAEKLSITDRAISKWERGICCPDISILKELSSILEVSVNELLAGEEIEKLEKEKTDDVLVDSVKQYTSIEKKKKKITQESAKFGRVRDADMCKVCEHLLNVCVFREETLDKMGLGMVK